MKYPNKIICTFLYFLFLLPVLIFSQKTDGIPFIKNYSPKEYNASPDNWAIAQDKRGIIYFGNAGGVLEYDGTKWTLIHVANTSLIRSIAIDSNGIVYIGAVGEFGFIAPNEKGIMIYHSLLEKLPKEERDFADVWKTHITSEGIYFQTFTKLIRIKNNSVKIWKPETSFHFSFLVNNKIYINERERGLKNIVNDEIVLVKNGTLFSGLRIYSMLPYQGNKILIATREKGFVLMNENTAKEDSIIQFWDVEANKNLIDNQVYGGVSLSNERYAYATLQNGILIINVHGNIVQIINKPNGLASDIINCVNTDFHNDLWIALDNGISRVEISSPLSFLNDSHGLNGSIQDIITYKGTLYVATSLGIFISIEGHFEQVKEISSQTRSLKKFITNKDTFLLAASEEGIYKIEKTTSYLIQEGFSYSLYQSKINPERIFIGMGDGLSSMRYENGNWIYEDYINGIDKEIRSIAEDNNGDLWLGTPFDGLIKIDFTENTSLKNSLVTTWNKRYKIYNYDTGNGLPDMKYNIPYNFKNKIVFATFKGIYEFDQISSHFNPSKILSAIANVPVWKIVPKDSSTIWMFTVTPSSSKETGIAYLQKDNTYSWYSKPFGKIRESEIHAIFPDDNGITWLGGPDGLLRYDENIKKDFSKKFYAHIRKVTIGKDSLIFGGTFYTIKDSLNIPVLSQEKFLIPTISFSNNSLRFEYSTTSFGDEQNNEFSIYLESFDEGWSAWSTKNLKEYTNLKEGNYIFHLKAKNIYGTESIESTYEFIISPPWYRTIWAYIGYVIAFICFVYIIIQLSIRRLVRTKMILEKTVKERTEEVVKQKEEVEIQKQLTKY